MFVIEKELPAKPGSCLPLPERCQETECVSLEVAIAFLLKRGGELSVLIYFPPQTGGLVIVPEGTKRQRIRKDPETDTADPATIERIRATMGRNVSHAVQCEIMVVADQTKPKPTEFHKYRIREVQT